MTTGDAAAARTEYHATESVGAACRRLRSAEDPLVMAGGQTLMLLLRQGFVTADAIVDVGAVPALSGISIDGDVATLGATTTYAALAAHEVSERATVLADACAVVGDPQVRAMGTLGGAVCHADPSFDVLAPLLCLDAELRLVDGEVARRLPLEEFLVGHMRTALGEAELLASLRVRLPGPSGGSAYVNHAPAADSDSTAGAATTVELEAGAVTSVRVGLTAVADTAVRAPAVEDELRGDPASADAIATASRAVTADVDPIDDRSGSADYKRQLAATLVERSLLAAVERAGGDP